VKLSGYPLVFDSPRPLRGLDAVETCGPALFARTLTERRVVRALINHDEKKVVATTADGTLDLRVESRGVRAAFTIPDTAPGLELLTSWLRGEVRGGSFAFAFRHGVRARWHVHERPWRREMLEAVIDEITIAVGGAVPAFRDTWAGVLGPELRRLQAQLDRHPVLTNRAHGHAIAPADVTLTRSVDPVLFPKLWGAFGIDRRMELEHADVERAVTAHPHARTVDVRYPRRVDSAVEASRRYGPVDDYIPPRRRRTR
jgi:uncharacterized protein